MFRIQLEKFEGPLDLLLKLIEEQKYDISRISLARVADEYLDYMRGNENIDLENLADFVSVASRIILIKSQSILPSLQISPEEEKEIIDLENQLREYQKFRRIADKIGEMLAADNISYSRDYLIGVKSVFCPPKNINYFDIKKCYHQLVSEIILPEKIPQEAVGEILTLEQKIEDLEKTLRNRIETSFSEMNSLARDKVEIIVAFLAMLELVKQRIISVEQKNLFEDIRITKVQSSEQHTHAI